MHDLFMHLLRWYYIKLWSLHHGIILLCAMSIKTKSIIHNNHWLYHKTTIGFYIMR
jgi:hypothetical protein